MLTMLIVDDNVSFRAQAARLCAAEGFSTVTAGWLAELAAVLSTSKPEVSRWSRMPPLPPRRMSSSSRTSR